VPHLFPRHGAQGRNSRCHESQLVIGKTTEESYAD
jgi:hypothetical protein